MAGSGSYARGDQPRSVPDNLKGPYEEMSKKQKRAHVWLPTGIATTVDSQTEPRRR